MDNTQREDAEQVIRDMAGTVISYVDARRSHPSFGYTKGMIRTQFSLMEGAIVLYMNLTKQASHAGAPAYLAQFNEERTQHRVDAARDAINRL
jgi:hypothetical protein